MPVRITSKQEGFRRCGVAHSSKPVVWPDDKFSSMQLKQLQTEPMLIVDIVSDAVSEPAPVSQVMTLGELILSTDIPTLQLARSAINARLTGESDVPGLLALREEINDALTALGYTDPLPVVPVDENTSHTHAGGAADGHGVAAGETSAAPSDGTQPAPESTDKPASDGVKDADKSAKKRP